MNNRDLPILKKAVIDLVKSNGHVTFADLQRRFPEMFGGSGSYVMEDKPWIVHWDGMSDLGCDVIEELINEGRMFAWPASKVTYAEQGVLSALPYAYEVIGTKERSWLPITFHISRCPESTYSSLVNEWV